MLQTSTRSTSESLISLGGRLNDLSWHFVSGSVALADGPIWIADGSPSAAHWIAERLDVCAATAREWIRVGRALSGLGATADAFHYEVLIHVRGDGNTLDDRTPIPDGPVASLLPTAFIRLLIHDAEARPVNASCKRRSPTDQQKRLVKERDQTHTDQLRCAPCHTNRHIAEAS
ncbi:MAG: hypothetical protein GXP35_06555 [Actinobacteria bacterium]|nr:hypothetical protein [Actinomycetota bacterium]